MRPDQTGPLISPIPVPICSPSPSRPFSGSVVRPLLFFCLRRTSKPSFSFLLLEPSSPVLPSVLVSPSLRCGLRSSTLPRPRFLLYLRHHLLRPRYPVRSLIHSTLRLGRLSVSTYYLVLPPPVASTPVGAGGPTLYLEVQCLDPGSTVVTGVPTYPLGT